MLAIPPLICGVEQNNAAATPSTTAPGTTVTGAGSAHTKGPWTQLIAALNGDCIELALAVTNTASAGVQTDALIDIGVGGAGSETALISNIPAGWRSTLIASPGPPVLILPVSIPRGTRLSARAQGLELSKAVNILVSARIAPSGGPAPAYQGCDVIGAVAASSQGTSHTPGNSGAFSSWASIGSATGRTYRAIGFVPQGSMNTAMNNALYRFEAGINSNALGSWTFGASVNEASGLIIPPRPVPCLVPEGSQLQVRATCSTTAQALDVVLLGFY